MVRPGSVSPRSGDDHKKSRVSARPPGPADTLFRLASHHHEEMEKLFVPKLRPPLDDVIS
jgi:hypothetical protein